MFKAIFILAVLTSSFTLASCQNKKSDNELDKQNVEPTEVTRNFNNNDSTVKIEKPCKASSAPIKDKSKIKKMLINSGKITVDMSDEQADAVVRNYVKKKQDAFKRCNK